MNNTTTAILLFAPILVGTAAGAASGVALAPGHPKIGSAVGSVVGTAAGSGASMAVALGSTDAGFMPAVGLGAAAGAALLGPGAAIGAVAGVALASKHQKIGAAVGSLVGAVLGVIFTEAYLNQNPNAGGDTKGVLPIGSVHCTYLQKLVSERS